MTELDPESVDSLDLLITFARATSTGMSENPDVYANMLASDLLESLAAWLEDAHGTRGDIETFNPWRFFARALNAGVKYE
ncbi:hypothetical protein [Nocardia cyriacigeorgica]|uniref:hypothetical protein n=1 Tax=Nocardia cyriacigeorgica TaxID=135487 RepID=UPI001895B720|nr:hypothetical protein [Nocardia cyriacigeorgica]MBF6435742.1 hypothetical protein [Nocardia cyriacigeorgica]MBF6454178.1 hypothetical protein [Nocardia cyriacigeorgica]MBF6477876.1 hypothetical protein [Nocardia cyriacigeorgica]MBF6552072.1 hypothetical protein [Nocardia cyriacigeorgica]